MALIAPGKVLAKCELLSTLTPQYVHNRNNIDGDMSLDRCCSEARGAAIDKFEKTTNLASQISSTVTSDAQKISAAANLATKTISGSYEQSESEATTQEDKFKGITWLAVVDDCECSNVKEKSADNTVAILGDLVGTKENGYCTADVECKFRYYSPVLEADCKDYLKDDDKKKDDDDDTDNDDEEYVEAAIVDYLEELYDDAEYE